MEMLEEEREAYYRLDEMPAIDERDEDDLSDSENEDSRPGPSALLNGGRERPGQKRKSWSDREEEESEDDMSHPPQRRRSNSSSPIPESPSERPARRGLVFLDGPDAMLRSDAHGRSSPDRELTPSPAQPPKPPSSRAMRRQLLELRAENEAVLDRYYSLGASYSEPISSMLYGLACDLGREDNDMLWLAIIGVSSYELTGRSESGISVARRDTLSFSTLSNELKPRIVRTKQVLREEVRRLNPPNLDGKDIFRAQEGLIPTTARSPMDTSIRLSPEPKFLLIRHWSLYDSMLHSPYLSSRLRVWTDGGRKKLHKMLAKMGVSLVQCKQSYTHMDMELKKGLRGKLLKYSKVYGLDELVPGEEGEDNNKEGWGFVRSWGWRATLSAGDVGVVVGSILEVGKGNASSSSPDGDWGAWNRNREITEVEDVDGQEEAQIWSRRFWDAFDALESVDTLLASLTLAQHLHRSLLRTGSSVIAKKQIRHLSNYRLCVLNSGPDLQLFTHPSALTKLALWLGEAMAEVEIGAKGMLSNGGRGTPLVVACLNEKRGCYVVVGTGGGGGGDAWGRGAEVAKQRKAAKATANAEKIAQRRLKRREREKAKELKREERALRASPASDSEEEEDTESESSESEEEESEDDEAKKEERRGFGLNKFGIAFQEVVEETSARARVDSFEHCVVEVERESLSVFLEGLSLKSVVG